MTKEEEVKFQYESAPLYELVLCTRDSNGKVTGKKSFVSDRPDKISDAWERHRGKPKRKKKTHAAGPEKTDKIVKEDGKVQVYTDTSDRVVTPEEQAQWDKREVQK